MGIDDTDTVTVVQMLEDQIAHQRCLSRTRLSDDVAVIPGLFGLNAEGRVGLEIGSRAELYEWVVHGSKVSPDSEKNFPSQLARSSIRTSWGE